MGTAVPSLLSAEANDLITHPRAETKSEVAESATTHRVSVSNIETLMSLLWSTLQTISASQALTHSRTELVALQPGIEAQERENALPLQDY